MKLAFSHSRLLKGIRIVVVLLTLINSVTSLATPANKTLRKAGETKAQMMQRLLAQSHMHDVDYKRSQAKLSREAKTRACCGIIPACHKPVHTPCCTINKLKNFEGFWQLDSIDDFQCEVILEFFRDSQGKPQVKYYDGTQNNVREKTLNDELFEEIPASTIGTIAPVEILGPKSLRIFNNGPILSNDDLTTTFRIQDEDPDTAYCMFWSEWDGVGDSPAYGVNVELSRFVRLDQKPDIQLNRLPSLETDWTNPVEMFNYVAEYYELMGEPQKAQALEQQSFIGWPAYQALKQTMLTTGITRVAQVSTAFRGGDYIGVWRTQYPDDFPLTTIITSTFHHMNQCSTVEISGFTGAYAVLNGTQKVAAFPPSTISTSISEPWQDSSSWEQFIYILYDSSEIAESYNPNIHGVATLIAQHGPITPNMGYRDYIAALADFVITAFGGTTHTALYWWVNDDLISTPETFNDLQQALASDTVNLISLRTRTYTANGYQLYWNPGVLGGDLGFPGFNLNDPFGLGLADQLDPNFVYDITIENYLDKSTVKNMFFTVTGPELPAQPITSLLVDDYGYTSNGSQVIWKANDFMTFPEPLVDAYGEHEWMQYNAALNNNSTGADEFAAYGFFGGIVRPEFSDGKVVAYLRVLNEDAFDGPLYELTVRSLAFGNKAIKAQYLSNWIAAWASLIEELNVFEPDRWIIDSRLNGGGFVVTGAWGSLFGGNRIGTSAEGLQAPGNGYRAPTTVPGSDIQTVFNSIPTGPTILDCDEAAAAFPNGVVRSNTKEIELIFLTSSHAASSGDVLPHEFLGTDSTATVHDLGNGVTSRVLGDIDGRLYAGAKQRDALPINTLSHNLHDVDGIPVTANYMRTEAGMLASDVNGYIVNPSPALAPNVLLTGWYDQTEWQDLGVTPIIQAYPLGVMVPPALKPAPVFADNTTWRDVWLENAIVN